MALTLRPPPPLARPATPPRGSTGMAFSAVAAHVCVHVLKTHSVERLGAGVYLRRFGPVGFFMASSPHAPAPPSASHACCPIPRPEGRVMQRGRGSAAAFPPGA